MSALTGTVETCSVKTAATWSCPSPISSCTIQCWCATRAMTCCWRVERGNFARNSSKSPSPQPRAECVNQIPTLWAFQAPFCRCHESHLLFLAEMQCPHRLVRIHGLLCAKALRGSGQAKTVRERIDDLKSEKEKEVKIFFNHTEELNWAELLSFLVDGEIVRVKHPPEGTVTKVALMWKAFSSHKEVTLYP